MSKRGFFIVAEGPEGAGKTEALKWVEKELKRLGIDVVFSREPGGTEAGEAIRNIVLNMKISVECRLLLFYAARDQYIRAKVAPVLDDGNIFLSDRFYCTTDVYQIRATNRPDLRPVFNSLRNIIVREYIPNMWILFDIDPQVGLARNKNVSGKDNVFEQEEIDFHRRVRDGYLAFFDEYARGEPHMIVNTTDFPPPTPEHNVAGKIVLDGILKLIGRPDLIGK